MVGFYYQIQVWLVPVQKWHVSRPCQRKGCLGSNFLKPLIITSHFSKSSVTARKQKILRETQLLLK